MEYLKKNLLLVFTITALAICFCSPEFIYAEDEGHEEHEGEEEEHSEHNEEAIVLLDEEARGMILLKTESAKKVKLGGVLKIYGKIAKDTENYSYINSEAEGKVEVIHVNLGDIVDSGDTLITIRKDNGTRDEILSKSHGTVLSIFVQPGEKFDKLTSLLSLVNVDTVRTTFDIYEKDLRLVKVGQEVLAKTSAYPDTTFSGEVVYISPQVDDHTRSVKIRVDIDNREHLLKLGMFVTGDLIIESEHAVLAVPTTAIQDLHGEAVVFEVISEGKYELKEVVLGERREDYVEVKEGLSEGDKIVTQGSFYLKSELAKESFGDGHGH